uniref:Uncharacterized protein n=1 Tax=Candidatus Kentrum sp. LPFa TaxID=2126335 RepID=A0A450W873_9GAMM|nr:MAG: hypothetical protein BECKLPF1236A_GA0070988_100843 [Candidatus Kentron sp. LPFa]VFK24462.1 MAG: hypothetical protein BECKLPF1236C_GA0070990_1001315 [Candidatus Kentron sp. LPFa]
MDEAHISRRLQNLLKDENNSLRVDDAAKIVGCWKALSKHQTIEAKQTPNPDPMRRAIAFCQVIEPNTGKAPKNTRNIHRVRSKQIAGMFEIVVEAYKEHDGEAGVLDCQAEHVDGAMNASQKEARLAWLRAAPPDNTCRILSRATSVASPRASTSPPSTPSSSSARATPRWKSSSPSGASCAAPPARPVAMSSSPSSSPTA